MEAKLNLWGLMAVVVGTMVAGGAFNLPSDMAVAAGSGGVLIAWGITGIGMISLALVFYQLSNRKSELVGGIYSYAKAGFGTLVGFTSAWGYWISSILGNIAFISLLFSSLSYFFPIFGTGNNAVSFIVGSGFIWLLYLLILRGVKQAAIINLITTIAKLIPIFMFIGILFFCFDMDVFDQDFWGKGVVHWSGVLSQVKSTMLVTLWTFVGIEGAVVLSGRAKHKKDVGRATVIGLLLTLVMYMMISILALGVLPREQLMGLHEPSMAYVLEQVVGKWGAVVINMGLIVSLSGAMLSWNLLSVEVPYVAAKDAMFPKAFTRENKRETPTISLLWTTILTQFFFFVVFLSKSTYQLIYSMASMAVLIPYLLSCLYQVKLLVLKDTYRSKRELRNGWMIVGLATTYAVWLLYAAGIYYLMQVGLLYAIGLTVFVKVQRENNRLLFTDTKERFLALGLIIVGIASLGDMVYRLFE